MVGDTCDACYGNGASGDVVSEYWEIIQKRACDPRGRPMGDRWAENNIRLGKLPAITSQKRQWEQEQQEQVDADYERAANATNPTGGGDYFT